MVIKTKRLWKPFTYKLNFPLAPNNLKVRTRKLGKRNLLQSMAYVPENGRVLNLKHGFKINRQHLAYLRNIVEIALSQFFWILSNSAWDPELSTTKRHLTECTKTSFLSKCCSLLQSICCFPMIVSKLSSSTGSTSGRRMSEERCFKAPRSIWLTHWGCLGVQCRVCPTTLLKLCPNKPRFLGICSKLSNHNEE